MIDLLRGHNRWMLLLPILLGLLLSVYPLPLELRWWRPAWVLLIVIYWLFTAPEDFSLTFVFGLGLVQDLITGSPLGQHSLGLVIVSYICLQSYQRVRNYARWQQALWVFVLVGISQVIGNWVYSMSGLTVSGMQFLYPALTSALLWPLMFRILEIFRTANRIS
ncbi:rod shape-determining protein MreD [Marinimicrobium alkaliphilum]|uniref:rod shape-determining protein MreD n=1 Tax=Marinimicrobium alkaliphilum TaxID=2202654 RepID=UPI001E467F35|nr:rod shape-determining protein MreD [Marinimicrobium alkaliphilum]